MKRCVLAAIFVIAGSARLFAADDQITCNDQKAHQPENVAACDRAISSGRFSGTALKDLYYNRARHWSDAREADKAHFDYSRALQLDPRNNDLLDRTFISALAAGKIDDGVALARRILTIDRTNRVAHLVLAVEGFKQEQYAAVQQDLKQSLRGPITELVAALLSGWASFGAGDVKAAVAAIDKLSGPDWFAVFKDLHAGLMFDLANRSVDAGARFERIYKLDASMLRVADSYARWLSRNRDAASAQRVYEAFELKLPRHPFVMEALRQVKAGDKLPALVDTPQAGAAETLYEIGATLTRRGGEDLGLVYLQLALYLQPNHGLALLSLADLYDFVKKPQLAIDVYRRIPASSPLWRNAQIQIAAALDASDRPDEGMKILRSIIADHPKDVDAQIALGNIERGRKKFVECGLTYTGAIDAQPKSEPNAWVTYYYRGICRERSRQWPLAEADLRKALELKPDQPNVLNYLGYALVDQGLKTDEALALIRRAVAQKPDDGYMADSLGWAYFQTGNLPEAEKNLKRAVELKRDDPTLHRHLGDVFWKLGLKPQARAEWTEALRLKPEPAEVSEIEDRIRDGLPDSSSGGPAKQTASVDTARQTEGAELSKPSGPAVTKVVIPSSRRVALVIGNAAYRSVSVLANPGRDSTTVAEALRQVGFQSVTLVSDATRDKMIEALRAFATEADKADWALIYYAGHGIEVGGLNYLIPVDAKLASDRDVQFETISLEQVMSAAEGAGKLRLVLLDACRDNPFANMMKRSTASRAVGRGLGRVEPDAGMLLVYAAKHGQLASDGDGQNSPFVSSFVKRIATPQIEIRKLFDLVRDDVMSATKRQQQPFTYGSVPGSEDFYFLTTEVAAKP